VPGPRSRVIENLEGNHPGIKERLIEDGGLRRFVNVYVNDEDVRFTGGLDTSIADGDQVVVLPAVAGGAGNRAEPAEHCSAEPAEL